MREKLKLISDVGDSGIKKCKQGEVWLCLHLAESGVRRSVLCWCFRQESGFSRREDVFTFDLAYKDIL
jgi:hypothetical protein